MKFNKNIVCGKDENTMSRNIGYEAGRDEKEIVTYLRGLINLEKAQLTIDKCKNKIDSIIKSNKSKSANNNNKVYTKEVSSVGTCFGVGIVTGIIGCVAIPFLLAFLCDAMELTKEDVGGGVEVLWSWGFKLAIALGVITIVVGLIRRQMNETFNSNQFKKAEENKRQEERELNEKYIVMLNKLAKCQATVNDALNTLYDADIISSKYRKLIPVAEFYDYFTFENASVTKLSGEFGAYSLYEENIDKRAILGNIDMLEDNLPGWIENQPTECNCIKEAQNIASNITNDGRLDKFVNRVEDDCRLILEDFDRCERYLSSYR